MLNKTEITRDEFIDDLLVFCKGWVSKVVAPIVTNVDELYEDKFLVAAVHEYAVAKRHYDEHREYVMRHIIDGGGVWTVEDLDDKYESRRIHYYCELLHTILADNE